MVSGKAKAKDKIDFNDKKLISYTRFSSFMNCPYKFSLKYKKGIRPEKESVKYSFGKAMHAALAYFYETKCTEEMAIEYFSLIWEEMTKSEAIDYGTKKVTKAMVKEDPGLADEEHVAITPAYYLDLGARMLMSYFETYRGEKIEVVGVEQSFTCPFKNPDTNYKNRRWELTGVIDLLLKNEDGTYEFWDHKMMGKKVSAGVFQLSHQVPAYILGAAFLLQIPIDKIKRCVFNIIYKTGDLECERIEVTRTKEEMTMFFKQLTHVAKAIDNDKIFQNFSFACASCEYLNYCLGKKDKYLDTIFSDAEDPDEL